VAIVFPRPPVDEALDVLLGANAMFFKVNRDLTHMYITENPTEITLVPRQSVRSASGGVQWSSAPARSPQTVRLVESSSQSNGGLQKASDGFQLERMWMLLMEWDASIAPNDRFTAQGAQWEVVDIMPENGYERRASVRRYG